MSGPGEAVLPQTPMELATGLALIPVFVMANAAFVAAEFALVAVRRTRVKELVQQGVIGAKALERAVADLDRYIAATQLGITLASVGLGWLGQPALAGLLLPLLERLGPMLSTIAANSIAFSIAFLGISFLHVVLGELAPKTMALQIPDRVGLWVTPPLVVFEKIFRPFIWFLNSTGNAFVRLLGFRPTHGLASQVHSVTELRLLMEASESAGVLERREREMVQGVLAFGEMTVSQIMVAKDQITGIRISDPPEQIIQAALESGYSRLPAWETGPEDIVGVLNVKDLLSFVSETERGLMVVQDLVRQPAYVRTATRLLDLMQEFQRGDHHLALVLDELGELVGLVTLEDLIEEIVGEIRDEYDTSDERMKLDRDGSFLATGDFPVRDCLSELGVTPPARTGGTLGEFLVQQHGGPLVAEATVTFEDLVFTILESSRDGVPRRVRIVKVPKPG